MQRDRNRLADEIAALATAIEKAIPRFDSGATELAQAVTNSRASVPEAARFSASVDAMRREVLSAADLVCWELRSTAVRMRAGNVNVGSAVPVDQGQPAPTHLARQLVYSLNALLWREGEEVRRIPAFTLVELPLSLLPVALRHQHVDHLSARRVQTLMQVHGSGGFHEDAPEGEPAFVDLDALAAAEKATAEANVA